MSAINLQQRLAQNFTLGEMIVSQTAARRGIDNTPPRKVIAALDALCTNVLQIVRDHYNRPVIVTSGYRSPELNRRIGGSSTSQHCLGEAADFTVPGISNIEVARWMERALNYDQLIYEYGEAGWIHCSYRVGRLRNMELSAIRLRNGRTKYLPGLI